MTMQDKTMKELQRIAEANKLDFVDQPDFPNRGTAYVQRGFETLVQIGYDFQPRDATFVLAPADVPVDKVKIASPGWRERSNASLLGVRYDHAGDFADLFANLRERIQPAIGMHDRSEDPDYSEREDVTSND